VQESRDQVKKMGETLRTLNGIFRNMQTDVETMRAADLKDQVRSTIDKTHTHMHILIYVNAIPIYIYTYMIDHIYKGIRR
jgi:hypothetical protein